MNPQEKVSDLFQGTKDLITQEYKHAKLSVGLPLYLAFHDVLDWVPRLNRLTPKNLALMGLVAAGGVGLSAEIQQGHVAAEVQTIDATLGTLASTEQDLANNPKNILDVKSMTDQVTGSITKSFRILANGSFQISPGIDQVTQTYQGFRETARLRIGTMATLDSRHNATITFSNDGQLIAVAGEDPDNVNNTIIYLSRDGGTSFDKLATTHAGMYKYGVNLSGERALLFWRGSSAADNNSNVDLLDLQNGTLNPVVNAGFVRQAPNVVESPDGLTAKLIGPGGNPVSGSLSGMYKVDLDLQTRQGSNPVRYLTDKGTLTDGFYVKLDSSNQPIYADVISVTAGELYKVSFSDGSYTTMSIDSLQIPGHSATSPVFKAIYEQGGNTIAAGGDTSGTLVISWPTAGDPVTNPSIIKVLYDPAGAGFGVGHQSSVRSAKYSGLQGVNFNITSGADGAGEVFIEDNSTNDKAFPNNELPPLPTPTNTASPSPSPSPSSTPTPSRTPSPSPSSTVRPYESPTSTQTPNPPSPTTTSTQTSGIVPRLYLPGVMKSTTFQAFGLDLQVTPTPTPSTQAETSKSNFKK